MTPITRHIVSLVLGASLLAIPGKTFGQKGAEYYRSPVGFPIVLAGNVGEIRSNHFHTGIDIKALQGIGSPVYAAADGYVVRVGISPVGYGHVLYVAHPNGETSVYGHLLSFSPKIARWVREQQSAKRSFRVDLYPEKGQFPVKQGERIASLGNTGSSAGPHLHFEIRDTKGRPRNLIAEKVYQVADHIPPVVSRIFVYDIDSSNGVPYRILRKSIAVETRADGTAIPKDSVISFGRRGYLAYEVIDYKDEKNNTMGLYALEQRVDGEPNFQFSIDRLDFATSSYVNTFVDYSKNRQAKRTSVLRAYISPNNRLAFYGLPRDVSDGTIDLSMKPIRQIETIFTDDAGNRTTLKFRIKRGADPSMVPPKGEPVSWSTGRTFHLQDATVQIPGGALYESMIMQATRDTVNGIPVVRVGNEDIPLQKAANVRFSVESLPVSLRSKAMIVSVDENGQTKNMGGGWEARLNQVAVSVKQLGCYAVTVDTVPPNIQALYASGEQIPAKQRVQWTATDNLSGIAHSTLTVDGKWAHLSWDLKSRTLAHTPVRGKTPKKHRLVLTVIDGKGNTQTWKGSYTW